MIRHESEIDAYLRSTLDEFRLSRTERKALIEAMGEEATSQAVRSLWRSRAFAVARSHPAGHLALDWLEEVVRALEAISPADPARGAVVASHARFSPGESCRHEIVQRFDQARTSVDICVFTITDDRISGAILDAHRRRVAIRLLTDDLKSGDLGSDIERLAEAGIPVRTDRRPAHMHHKFAIFDGDLLLNGSYNWTRNAAIENCENLITSTDQGLVREFQREFDRNWKVFE